MNTTKQHLTVVAFLGIITVSIFFCKTSRGMAADAQVQPNKTSTNDLAKKLIGTWKLESAVTPGSPSGIGTRLKLFTATHWCVIQPDRETGVIVFQHGGRYVLDGNKMKESIDFAGEHTKASIGKTSIRIVEVDGDTYKQVDPNGVFTETWKRVK